MMATSSTNPGDSAATMHRPTQVDGLVELQTLANIHKVLNESEHQDDLALATWVKNHYLFEPIGAQEEGRSIETAEGFSKLERAWRRVRSLTNKAQDKWPFFENNWKKMSSAKVKLNARAESVTDNTTPNQTTTPNTSGEPKAGASLLQSATELTQDKQIQRVSSRKRKQEDLLLSPASTTSFHAALPTDIKIEAESSTAMSPSSPKKLKTFDPNFELRPESQQNIVQAQELNNGAVDELHQNLSNATQVSQTTANRDLQPETTQSPSVQISGKRKVRGTKGRSTKDQTRGQTPQSELNASSYSTRSKRRASQESRASSALSEGQHEGKHDGNKELQSDSHKTENNAVLTDEHTDIVDTQEHVASDEPSFDTARSSSEPFKNARAASQSSQGSSVTFKLAAESEPVRTNLDNLPPASLRKRKFDTVTRHSSPRKRARSSQIQRRSHEVEETTEKATSEPPVASAMKVDEPMMVTRRSKRQSARASLSPPEPEKESKPKATATIVQDSTEKQDQDMVDAGQNRAASVAPHMPDTSKSKGKSRSFTKAQSGAAGVPDRKLPGPESHEAPLATDEAKATPKRGPQKQDKGKGIQHEKEEDVDVNGNKKISDSAGPSQNYGYFSDDDDYRYRVDYVAKVQLGSKMVEIPMMTKNLNKEAKFIEQYMDFVEANDADNISFGLYKGLVEDRKKPKNKPKKKMTFID